MFLYGSRRICCIGDLVGMFICLYIIYCMFVHHILYVCIPYIACLHIICCMLCVLYVVCCATLYDSGEVEVPRSCKYLAYVGGEFAKSGFFADAKVDGEDAGGSVEGREGLT